MSKFLPCLNCSRVKDNTLLNVVTCSHFVLRAWNCGCVNKAVSLPQSCKVVQEKTNFLTYTQNPHSGHISQETPYQRLLA